MAPKKTKTPPRRGPGSRRKLFRLLQFDAVEDDIRLADILRHVGLVGPELLYFSRFPFHLLLLAVGIIALDRSARHGAHDSVRPLDIRALIAGLEGHLVDAHLVVLEQYFLCRFARNR